MIKKGAEVYRFLRGRALRSFNISYFRWSREMLSGSYNRTPSSHSSRRSLSFSSPRVSAHRKLWAIGSVNTLAAVFFLVSLVLVLGCALYLYVFRSFGHGGMVSEFVSPSHGCDVFEGSWIPDGTYPLYNSSDCPFAERGFDCLANGRTDTDYLKWKWKPRECEIPRFDVHEILEKLRGKRIVFVGDSMSRSQWESFICLLMTGVQEPNSVYEVNGNQISKTIRFLGVHFRSFNFTVEFFRSVFLVQQGSPPRHGPKRVRSTLKLDKLDDINRKWVDSDVLIFNSGHWWTPGKLFDVGCYFQVGGSLKLGMPITTAFRIALDTWASWVETTLNTTRTRIFFRTFEPSHWSDPNQKVCEVTQQPMVEAIGNGHSEFSDIITDVVSRMRVPVIVLNVTSMGALRSDAHIGTWSDLQSFLDCSHWCLPGVPDAWNELVLYLLTYSGTSLA